MMAASNLQAADVIDAARLMAESTWEKRVLLVFAPNNEDTEFRQQDAVLKAIGDGLIERDMSVIRAFSSNRLSVDGKAYEQSTAGFYRQFAVQPGEFRVILVGKDGTVKLNRRSAVSDQELFSLIDSMPMRRQEMLEGG